jgi:hypothetical protein
VRLISSTETCSVYEGALFADVWGDSAMPQKVSRERGRHNSKQLAICLRMLMRVTRSLPGRTVPRRSRYDILLELLCC